MTVVPDMMVECEEDFTVELTLDTNKDSLSLGDSSTLITLVDSDGMQYRYSEFYPSIRLACVFL